MSTIETGTEDRSGEDRARKDRARDMQAPWLETERRALAEAIEAGRLGHAPMLLGSAGVGKRALAEWLVRRLLCAAPVDGEPCAKCKPCTLLASGTHPDFFRLEMLEDKTEIVVDQVREFIASLALTPSLGSRRLGLIAPADRLNRNAANALLKTLEEPAANVWLILVTEREDRLPVTVVSRCQRRYIAVPDRGVALDWVGERHPDRDRTDCRKAMELADGAPLLADEWLAGAGLEEGVAIGDALGAVLAGRADEFELVEAWSRQPDATWGWLARYSHLWLRAVLAAPEPGFEPGVPIPGGPAAVGVLEHCWRQALEGRRLATRPVRHDWLLLRWLADWRGLAGAGGVQ
ncbi:MAG: hypothetical protein RQ847_09615 [Wenzhouxiangellaceae bacterium]|nr:hypothetical protein [Wenzhouxiangellaceae bacterium]